MHPSYLTSGERFFFVFLATLHTTYHQATSSEPVFQHHQTLINFSFHYQLICARLKASRRSTTLGYVVQTMGRLTSLSRPLPQLLIRQDLYMIPASRVLHSTSRPLDRKSRGLTAGRRRLTQNEETKLPFLICLVCAAFHPGDSGANLQTESKTTCSSTFLK